MNELNREALEKSFFRDADFMTLPELVPIYFEGGEYELSYYLSKQYEQLFSVLKFYEILSLGSLNYYKLAQKLYKTRDDWLDIAKENHIYWRHVLLFIFAFRPAQIPNWIEAFDEKYYDDPLIIIFNIAQEYGWEKISNISAYQNVMNAFPLIRNSYKFYTQQMKKESSKKKLVTFEDRQWSIWNHYNQKLFQSPLLSYHMQCVYQEGDFCIYSYKPHQVAASMHILTDGESSIILDCGTEIQDGETVNIPVKNILRMLQIKNIKAVFLSHGHLDHYGSLVELKQFPCYMTRYSCDILQRMYPLVLICDIHIVEEYSTVVIDSEDNSKNIFVKFIPNGHIPGSVMLDISWKKKKRILYTGDYSTANQKTCKGFQIKDVLQNPKRVNIFLTESTYGNRNEMLSLAIYESIFKEIVKKLLEQEKKIIIPGFAVGRAQEISLLLKPILESEGKTLFIDGLAATMTEYYQNTFDIKIAGRNITIANEEHDLREKIDSYDVIVASSGMLQENSTSYNYLKHMLSMGNICFVKPGFIHPYEDMLVSVLLRKDKNVMYFDIPLSAHADYNTLVHVADVISADTTVYIHGSGIKKPLYL